MKVARIIWVARHRKIIILYLSGSLGKEQLRNARSVVLTKRTINTSHSYYVVRTRSLLYENETQRIWNVNGYFIILFFLYKCVYVSSLSFQSIFIFTKFRIYYSLKFILWKKNLSFGYFISKFYTIFKIRCKTPNWFSFDLFLSLVCIRSTR